ncbi:DUF1631 family protein [Halioglobus maricola]|uniref:DUF1631 family protein n=1 Tax=Halioglobus maricola TaxID=2601894 RepID=A0A5P9NMJ2_9GAMM|nr:DUF1631 family protein [Halioglobus maricola]QFU76972.1 DUF1631 family protein [Halioglobus maricola]
MTRSFAVPEQSNMQQPALEWDELLGYLREIEDFNKPPLDALLAQTEVVGDPSMPKPAECAVLRWIDRIFQEWEQSFPLEWELTYKLRALKPAMAIASLSEEPFFRPGQHPLHQMMDAIHDVAIGWQGDLGRAGQPVIALVDSAISDVRACLDQSGDVRGIADRVIADAARIHARAKKMTERTVAAEQGRLRAARAKTIAADVINEQLQRYPAPAAMNSLLHGPWYESAQLTYLKFGDKSAQWRDFSDTTGQLLQAMQPTSELGDEEREQRQKLATILPAELRRLLLSIQHESDLLQQETTAFEYLLQRVAQNQPLELSYLLPIASGTTSAPAPADAAGANVGQWYEVCQDSDVLRLQVAMLEAGEVLLCNTSGARALSMPLAEFTTKIRSGDAQPLATGATFSRAAAAAAGVDSDEALAKLSAPSTSQSASSSAPAPADGDSVPDLPIGTWLGFHDTDPPMLAKLALHDKVQSLLIFVNRQGIELRRLREDEYLALIQAGQVDIMEARNNFREQVERARTQMQQDQGPEGL